MGTANKVYRQMSLLPVSFISIILVLCSSCGSEKIPSGRWDVTVYKGRQSYPSWLEIEQTENGLKGRFVGRVGSVRPITTLIFRDRRLSFSLPVQWEKHPGDMEFNAIFDGDKLSGTTFDQKGNSLKFEAVPAPVLDCEKSSTWNETINLLEEEWELRYPDSANGWSLQEGILENIPPSEDLLTRKKFANFILNTDIFLPEKSNSGIYLRGRYEVQLTNLPPLKTGDKGKMGAIYGFIAPDTLFDTPPGMWHSLEITLLGRCVTVKLNDILIIDKQEIPGITGGALDSKEGEPGSLMLQGDHGPVKFRNMILRTAGMGSD